MSRAALFALLVAFVLDGSLHAQRVSAGFHGSGSSARVSGRSGFAGHRVFPYRFYSSRSHLQHGSFGSGLYAYDEPFAYAQTDGEATADEAMPLAVIPRPDEKPLREPEPHALKPLVIEIPAAPNSGATKMPPPAIFILANGERVETRRFLLTASVLTLSVDRRQRVVPFDMLDTAATISANRERGIDLRIPLDRNEISLGF
jgi:hypothetical protein